MLPFVATVVGSLRSARDRLVTAAAVSVRSGLAWDLHPRGLATAARLLANGRSGPSTIYRIHGDNTPRRLALVAGDRSFTFGELDAAGDRVASGLRRAGLSGKAVLVAMKNRPEALLLGPGASRVGCPVVMVSHRSTEAELVYLANHCGAAALVFDEAVEETVARAREKIPGIAKEHYFHVSSARGARPRAGTYTSFDELLRAKPGAPSAETADEGAVVVYTSGTTGKPKGAVRKFNKELLPSVMRLLRETPLRHDDVHLACCPLYHTTAFGFIAFTHVLGGQVLLLDEFDPIKVLEAIERHRVTTTVLVPTMLHRLLGLGRDVIRRYDTRTLRAIFCTSAPLPGPDSDEAMALFGDIVWNLYGSTETGAVTLARPQDLRASPGTIGRAVPGNEIRLLDDEGKEVPDGQVGELFAKNAMLVAGYHEDDAATRGAMRDGFFSVGDLARRDARGCYHLEGRKRDMIISGGVNVYPAEVEQLLEKHPDVDEVAVVGVPDPEWGERVQAVVVISPGAEADVAKLRAYCKERLSGAKVPREFVILPPGQLLPRNPTGKVLKRELRARAGTGPQKEGAQGAGQAP